MATKEKESISSIAERLLTVGLTCPHCDKPTLPKWRDIWQMINRYVINVNFGLISSPLNTNTRLRMTSICHPNILDTVFVIDTRHARRSI